MDIESLEDQSRNWTNRNTVQLVTNGLHYRLESVHILYESTVILSFQQYKMSDIDN